MSKEKHESDTGTRNPAPQERTTVGGPSTIGAHPGPSTGRVPAAPSNKAVCFVTSGQHFAVPIRQVKETVALKPITRVFLTPEFVRGVVNLRGDIVAVLDLAQLLGLPPQEAGPSSKIVIVRARGKVWGLLVQEMSGVRPYMREDLQDAAEFLGQHPDWVLGTLPGGDPPSMVLDMDRLLDFGPIRALAADPEPRTFKQPGNHGDASGPGPTGQASSKPT